jgi:AraC-like DNA-binding protein
MPSHKRNQQTHLPWLLPNRLIPWARDEMHQRIIVARPQMIAADIPETVQMERRPLRGKRRIDKGQRRYANTRMCSVSWPDSNLIEIEIPKIVCVVNGVADYQVGEYLLTCPAGYFIIIPPRTPHPNGDHSHLEGPRAQAGFCDLLQIIAHNRGLQCWICRSEGTQHSGVHAENYLIRNEQAIQLFHLLAEEAVSDKENHKPICQNLLVIFLMLLQREFNAGHYLLPGPRVTTHESPAASATDFLTGLNKYVLGHLNESLTLESVARQMHLSRAQFARRIRQQTGQTFIAYLTERRLEEARILLRESEWTTIAISEFVGFQSSTYFHRLFRERMKMTPGEFRLKNAPDIRYK